MGNLLEIKNLMVFFENAIALNDFSMTLKEKEIVGILGSNSAGKTTLMNVISGLIEYMKTKEDRRGGVRITVLGEVKYQGENILSIKTSERVKRGIVICQERHPIFRDCGIEESLDIAGYLHKRKTVKKRKEFVFETFPHLKSLLSRKAGLLSGGEQQMLAIGMALVAGPRLFLLDEPLLGLSPALQTALVRSIQHVAREGITILVSEQFARPLLPVIERGYIIENGMLVLKGTGKELMGNPEVQAAYFGT